MIAWIRKKLAPVFYVQIWENKIKVTDVATKKTFEDQPIMAFQTLESGEKRILAIGKEANTLTASNITRINPFSHPRVLFSDFFVGEKLLQHAFSTFAKHKFIRITPKTIIHPMEKTEGGLTMIEIRAFKEMALGAGANEVKVYVGSALSIASFNYELIEDNSGINSIGSGSNGKDETGLAITLLVVFIVAGALFLGAQ